MTCPMCGAEFEEGGSYIAHLGDAHGLVDDAGTKSVVAHLVASVPPAPIEAPPPPPPPPPPLPFTMPPPPPGASSSGLPAGAIVAVAAGCILVMLMLVGLAAGHTSHVSTFGSPSFTSTPNTPVAVSKIKPVVASSTIAGSSVDPAEAYLVAIDLWEAHMQARHDRDIVGIQAVEAGVALEADIGYICFCDPIEVPTASQISVDVPHQSTWPATFLASITYTATCDVTSAPCADTFVATQAAESEPWHIVLYVAYAGTIVSQQPAFADGGWADPQPPLTNGSASSLPAEFADYYNALATTGLPPATMRLQGASFTSELTSHFHRTATEEQASGFVQTTTYTADPDVYAFATSEGSTTVCGSIRYESTTSALPGRVVTQPDDHSLFDQGIAPGDYSAVIEHGVHIACFAFLDSDPSTVSVLASYGDRTDITGVPVTR